MEVAESGNAQQHRNLPAVNDGEASSGDRFVAWWQLARQPLDDPEASAYSCHNSGGLCLAVWGEEPTHDRMEPVGGPSVDGSLGVKGRGSFM